MLTQYVPEVGFSFCFCYRNEGKNEKNQLVGLFFQPSEQLSFPPPSPPSPTSLHTLFLAPGILTGCSSVPSLALPSQVSTPQALPVGLSFGDDAAAAAEGDARDTDQKHFSVSFQEARAILTEEAPAP